LWENFTRVNILLWKHFPRPIFAGNFRALDGRFCGE
jgi:hypothetical protein